MHSYPSKHTAAALSTYISIFYSCKKGKLSKQDQFAANIENDRNVKALKDCTITGQTYLKLSKHE